MAKKVRLSVKEYDKILDKLGRILKEMHKELFGIHEGYMSIVNGDGDGPFWNGSTAKKTFKTAIVNINKNVEAYNALHEVFTRLWEKRNGLTRKGLVENSK